MFPAAADSLLHPFLEMKQLGTVTHALVTSRLDYSDVLNVGLPLKRTWKSQLVPYADWST